MKRLVLISLICLGFSQPETVFADGPETAVKPTSLTTVYADGRHNMNVAIAKWKDRY